jgi:mono/diheme cytochrome c family protein
VKQATELVRIAAGEVASIWAILLNTKRSPAGRRDWPAPMALPQKDVRRVRFLVAVFIMLSVALPGRPARCAAALERGTAIIDPLALRALDQGRFGLGRFLAPSRSSDASFTSGELFDLPSMAPVRKALDAEFDRYIAKHKADLPNETIGVGTTYDFQLFDRAPLYSGHARFMLAGIVNRMDRAYVSEANCGEIRLIYRLIRTDMPDAGIGAPEAGQGTISPRLPMTLNLVLHAKGDSAATRAVTCAEIARRWLAAGDLSLTGAELAEKLTSADGPLDLVQPENIHRIETNLQIAHAPKSAVRDFRTDYLFKVFDYNAPSRTFEQAPLENQIDRDRILADEKLKSDFKAWLLDPRHFGELDRGTILIPDRFLATAAIGPTPVGFAPSNLQPAFGLVQGEGNAADPVFSESDVVAALKQAADNGEKLLNIRSLAGFERRLNDVTCSGCHQTRGIGGFHFPGVDWMAPNPNNSTIVPASPHFFGDQVRRRDIITALRDGRQPDYSRGFASRPQLRGSTELAGTEYDDGWGGHCYIQHADAADNDASFKSWTCAEGLACQPMDKASRIGMCFIGGAPGKK